MPKLLWKIFLSVNLSLFGSVFPRTLVNDIEQLSRVDLNFSTPHVNPKKIDSIRSNFFVTGEGFEFLGVDVPQVIDPRLEKVVLRCEYDLGNDQLYSVKWYKDKDEFYTFMPSTSPPGREYDVKGVKVDIGRSDSKQVVLLGQARSPHSTLF